MGPRQQRGVTLIELVAAITIVSIAAIAVLGAISLILSRGADAMARQQAVAVAEAYLEEIMLQPVVQPTGGGSPTTRATYNDIDQYNGIVDAGAQDQFGNPITNLSGYTVRVAVAQSAALSGVPASATRRIDVTVTAPTGVTVQLSGYRTSY